MDVTFCCPRCERTERVELPERVAAVVCGHCQLRLTAADAVDERGRLRRCLVCPSTDLFLRKDFPQRLGVGLVIVGFLASSVAWYYYRPWPALAVLLATALIDAVLYFVCGDAVSCYRCGAIYRGVPDHQQHPPFSLEVHERHRQQAARVGMTKLPND
jgi:hypothetical protein